MKIASVLLARTIAWQETSDLSPQGGIFGPDFITKIVQKYGFQKFPQAFTDLDVTKGVEFLGGRTGNHNIDKFVIYNTGLLVETQTNTADSKRILEEMLGWGKEQFGLAYEPGMLKRWGYVSNVSFYTDFPLLSAISDPWTSLVKSVSKAVSEIWNEDIQYVPMHIMAGHDPLKRKYGIAPFSIAHRAEIPFSENKYFSDAPLPTDLHISLLQEFEAAIIRHSTVTPRKP